jgi:hypothetical protein
MCIGSGRGAILDLPTPVQIESHFTVQLESARNSRISFQYCTFSFEIIDFGSFNVQD